MQLATVTALAAILAFPAFGQGVKPTHEVMAQVCFNDGSCAIMQSEAQFPSEQSCEMNLPSAQMGLLMFLANSGVSDDVAIAFAYCAPIGQDI